MNTWSDLAAAAPEIAEAGRRLIYRREIGEALLATVRDDEPPRINPIYVAIADGRLLAFLHRSPKQAALASDGRYALHTYVLPEEPDEFLVRGRARVIDSQAEWATAAARWYFEVDADATLFEFSIETALLGERPGGAWPPRYSSWRAEGFAVR
ncbi:MAG TPA: hypothetical protein VFV72_04170 [Candidatus Limnocylindrales bacterium]|nr:hypothetical protein [Candidatus Limnocylindrales bacterium]